MRGDRKREDALVYEEHVVCGNCRGHYAYLFEAAQTIREGKLGPVPPQADEAEHARQATMRLERYANPRESWRPCPRCDYVQPWMQRLAQRAMQRDACVVAALIPLPFVAFAATRLALTGGSLLWLAWPGLALLMAYAALAALALAGYRYHVTRHWNPNRGVDVAGACAERPVDNAMPNTAARMERAFVGLSDHASRRGNPYLQHAQR